MSQQQFTAGTDHPFFYDKHTDTYYGADWDTSYAFPFGYWNLGNGMKLYVGDACSTHNNPFGKALKDHYESTLYEYLDDDAYTISDRLSDLAKDVQQYGYTYNEDEDEYVSEDQSDFFTVDEKADEIAQDLYNPDCYDIVYNLVQETLKNGTYPDSQEVYTTLENNMTDKYDFQDNRVVKEYLMQNGFSMEDTFMDCGEYIGRIWTEKEIISFYTDKQPEPDELPKILQDLSQRPELRTTYNDLLKFNIIFEAYGQNTGREYVTACTTADYISDNYNHNGPYYDDDEEDYDDDYDDDNEQPQQQTQQYNELGMPIHLANQQQKRQFFQNFRNDRDQYINVPKEKAAGTIARYNALRHPYGESKQYNNMIRITEAQLRRIITEAANIILNRI